MNTCSRFIVLTLLALGVLCDAEAQKFRGLKPQMVGGAMSPLDAATQTSSLSQPSMPRPALTNLLGRRLLVPQQYTTIQAAIDSAVHGDTVLVSTGTYYENINFRGKAIVVASYMIFNGDTTTRNNTIVNGSQPIDPTKGSVVCFVSGEDTTSAIYGFTITGGTGTLYDSNNKVGGGIYVRSSGARIVHNRIVSNAVAHSMASHGGGIGYWPQTNDARYVIIEDNVIESNSVSSSNASVYIHGGGVRITNGRIARNLIRFNSISGQATFAGGGGISAVCQDDANRTLVRILGNIITHNQAIAPGTYGGYGGGVDVVFCNVHLLNNAISHNEAGGRYGFGAGIRLWRSKSISIVKNNTISFNTVTASGNGGGLFFYETTGLTVEENHFEGNTCEWGGAILSFNAPGTNITGNTFIRNRADSSGGALYCEGPYATMTKNLFGGNRATYGGGLLSWYGNLITNNIFHENAAHWGGGIFSGDDPPQNYLSQIMNNTVTGNVADTAGGIAVYTAKVALLNTISWGNTAPHGPEIWMWGGTLNAAYSDIRFGRDSIAIDSAATINWLSGNITSAPAFRDTTMRLADTSRCIGAAVDSMQIDGVWLHAPPFCIYGMPRPTPAGTRPDIGACENPSGPTALQWQLQTTLSGTPPLYSISTVSDRVAWTGSFYTIYRTTNAGMNWTPTPTNPSTSGDIAYIKALGAETAFIGGGGPNCQGGNARIYRTTNGGANWSIVYTATGTTSYWNAIHFFDAQNAIAMSDPPNPGERFLIVKSTDAGITWTPIANPPIPNSDEYGAQNMFFFDRLHGWFGTGHITSPVNAGRVFRTTDGGNSWTGYPSGNTGWVSDVLFVSPMVGIRTSYASPFVRRSTDGGQTWTHVPNLPVGNIRTIYCGTSVNTSHGIQIWVNGLTLADEPFILTSTDHGATWHNQPLPPLPPRHVSRLSAVSFGAQNDSVQIFGVTMDYNTSSHGGEIFSYRQKIVTSAAEDRTNMPTGYSLSQNYPNPFNPVTTINYQLPTISHVALKVFDILGREVETLVNEQKSPGSYTARWDATGVASGVYFYRLQAGEFSAMRRMLLIK